MARLSGAEERIDWRQVRLIVAASWRIRLRGVTSGGWKVALVALAWMTFGGFLAAATAGAGFGVHVLRSRPELEPLAAALLHAGFLFVLVSLAVSPALGLRGNEFLDVTKLFLYPVNHRTVFAASLAGLLTSASVLLFTLPLLAAVAGWGGSALELAAGTAAALLVVLVGVAMGQTGLLLFLDVFRSRRWRDLSRLVAALLAAGTYVALRLVSRSFAVDDLRAAADGFEAVHRWTMPLPSWWGSHAVTGDGPARWLPALALPAALWFLVRAAGRLQERAYFSEIEERRETTAQAERGVAAWIGARFRDPLGAALEKDVRILLRDPTVRILLIQQLAFSIMPLVVVFLDRGGGATAARTELYLAGIVYVPVLAAIGLTLNPLGTEGVGVQHGLLTPAPRRTILAGKALALLAVVGGGLSLLVAAGAFAISTLGADLGAGASAGRAGLAVLESLAAFTVATALGAVLGPIFPVRIALRDRRALRQTSAGQAGCLRSLAYLGGILAIVALCVPVTLGFHHPALARLADADSTAYLALSVPAALAYACALLWAAVRIGGSLLARREETVLAELCRSDE